MAFGRSFVDLRMIAIVIAAQFPVHHGQVVKFVVVAAWYLRLRRVGVEISF